jgi:hypothetical protein
MACGRRRCEGSVVAGASQHCQRRKATLCASVWANQLVRFCLCRLGIAGVLALGLVLQSAWLFLALSAGAVVGHRRPDTQSLRRGLQPPLRVPAWPAAAPCRACAPANLYLRLTGAADPTPAVPAARVMTSQRGAGQGCRSTVLDTSQEVGGGREHGAGRLVCAVNCRRRHQKRLVTRRFRRDHVKAVLIGGVVGPAITGRLDTRAVVGGEPCRCGSRKSERVWPSPRKTKWTYWRDWHGHACASTRR